MMIKFGRGARPVDAAAGACTARANPAQPRLVTSTAHAIVGRVIIDRPRPSHRRATESTFNIVMSQQRLPIVKSRPRRRGRVIPEGGTPKAHRSAAQPRRFPLAAPRYASKRRLNIVHHIDYSFR